MSLLTRNGAASSFKPAPPAPPQKNETLEAVKDTLSYLKAPHEERARREAQPIIDQVTARLAAEAKVATEETAKRLAAEATASLAQETEKEMTRLAGEREAARVAEESERAARVRMEERLGSIEAQRAVDLQQLEQTQASMAELRASGDRLRAELTARDAEAQQLREASARAAEEYTRALADATAATQRAASIEAQPKLIYQPPVKPEAINFEYHKDLNGYLTRVVLKAEGYEDVAVDIIRDGANRMRDLKIGGRK